MDLVVERLLVRFGRGGAWLKFPAERNTGESRYFLVNPDAFCRIQMFSSGVLQIAILLSGTLLLCVGRDELLHQSPVLEDAVGVLLDPKPIVVAELVDRDLKGFVVAGAEKVKLAVGECDGVGVD